MTLRSTPTPTGPINAGAKLAPPDDPNVIPLAAPHAERRQAVAGLINEYRQAS